MKFIVTFLAVATFAAADVSHVVNQNYGPPANSNQHFTSSFHGQQQQQQQQQQSSSPHNYSNKSTYSIQRSIESIVPSVPIASFNIQHNERAQSFLGTEHQQQAAFTPILEPLHQTHSGPAQHGFMQEPYQHHQTQELLYNQQSTSAGQHQLRQQAPPNAQIQSSNLHIQQAVLVPQQHSLYAYSAQPLNAPANLAQHQVQQNLFSPQQIEQTYSTPQYVQQSYSAPQQVQQQSYSAPQQVQQSYSAPQTTFSASQQVQQSYSAPQTTFSAPQQVQQSYSAPQATYSAPQQVQQSYSAPQKSQQTTYSAPQQVQQSYSAPQKSQQATYSAPQQVQQSYSVPQKSQRTTYSAPQQVQKSYSAPQKTLQRTYSAPQQAQQSIQAPKKAQKATFLAPVQVQESYTAPQKKKKNNSAPKKVPKTDLAHVSEQKVSSLELQQQAVHSNSKQMQQKMQSYLSPQEIQQVEHTQQMQQIISASVEGQKVDIKVQPEAQNTNSDQSQVEKSNRAAQLEVQQSNSAPHKMELAETTHASEQTVSEVPQQEPIRVEDSKSAPLQHPQQIQQTPTSSAPLPNAYSATVAQAQSLPATHPVVTQPAFSAQTQNLYPNGYSQVHVTEASNFVQPQQQFYSGPIQQFVPTFSAFGPSQQSYSLRSALPLSYTNQQALSGQQLNGFNFAAPLQQIYSNLPQYEQAFSSPIQQTFAIPRTSQNTLNYFRQAPVQQTYSISAQPLPATLTQIQQNNDLPIQQPHISAATTLQNQAESSVSVEKESFTDSAPAAEYSSSSMKTEVAEDSNQNKEKKR